MRFSNHLATLNTRDLPYRLMIFFSRNYVGAQKSIGMHFEILFFSNFHDMQKENMYSKIGNFSYAISFFTLHVVHTGAH